MKTFLILQYLERYHSTVQQLAYMGTFCIFESSQLEGLYVGDLV